MQGLKFEVAKQSEEVKSFSLIASQLLETNTKLLEALKISGADSSTSSLESSIESEVESTRVVARKLTNIAELQIPDSSVISQSAKNMSLKDSLKKWNIMNWKGVNVTFLCPKQKRVLRTINFFSNEI